ncbi:MAG: hypothetical protein MK074_09735, partial [Phycisphaerales bacterium]|nr:hypothetical protein [Phycisphaerales bacterium]
MARLSYTVTGGLGMYTGTCIAAAFAFASFTQSAAAEVGDSIVPDAAALSHEHLPNAVFMRFKQDTPMAARANVLDAVRGTVTEEYWLVPRLVRVDTGVSVAQALQTLGQRGDVLEYIEPVYIVHTMETVPNDPMYNQLWGMEMINAPLGWDDHVGDQEFAIAIIDTGFNYNHQDLAANAWTN